MKDMRWCTENGQMCNIEKASRPTASATAEATAKQNQISI